MPRNPYISRYKEELQQREERRQDLISKRRGRTAAKYLAAGVGAAAALHVSHPEGLIGALDKAGEVATSTAKAFKETTARYGADLTPGGYKGTKQLLSEFGKAKTDFKERYKQYASEKQETLISEYKRKAEQQIQQTGYREILQRRRDYIKDNIQQVLQAEDVSEGVKDKLRSAQQGEIDLARIADQQVREIRTQLAEKGIEGDAAGLVSDIVQKSKEVAKITGKKTSSPYEIAQGEVDRLKEQQYNKMLENFAKEAQETKAFNIKDKALEKMGYKRATAQDLIELKETADVDIDDEFLKEIAQKGDIDLAQFVPDENLFVRGGKIVDSYRFTELKMGIRSSFSEGLLGGLAYQGDAMQFNKFAIKPAHYMRPGTDAPTLSDLDAVDSEGILQEGLIGIGNKIYRHSDMSVVKEGVSFTSGRFGTTKRMITRMSGVNAPDWGEGAWWESKTLDITSQGQPGMMTKLKAYMAKEDDPDYLPNKLEKFRSQVVQYKKQIAEGKRPSEVADTIDSGLVKDLRDFYRYQGYAHDAEVLDKVTSKASDPVVSSLKFDSEQDLVTSFVELSRKISGEGFDEDVARSKAKQKLQQATQRQFKGFLSKNELVSGEEHLRKEIGKLLYEDLGKEKIATGLKDLYSTGEITRHQLDKSHLAINEATIEDVYQVAEGPYMDPVVEKLDLSFHAYTQNFVEKTHPSLGHGVLDSFEDSFDADVIPVKQTEMNFKELMNFFTAGRGNMYNVTRPQIYAFGTLTRLSDIVGGPPIGLSDESMGSIGSFLGNIMAKRVLPIGAGIAATKYASDHLEDYTGYTGRQHYERGKAHTRLTVSRLMDNTSFGSIVGGLAGYKAGGVGGALSGSFFGRLFMPDPATDTMDYIDRLTPGSEGLGTALGSVPGPGWAASFTGAFSGKSEEDWVDYYKHGQDPVRRGRYWPLGNTAWMGEGISHFEPNSYQQAMAEPQYTDTVYGSKENYWKHHWMPTPRYPLAPVRRFITDRYWFEDMHRKRRPYPLSGEMFDPNSPWGVVLNPTVGQIMKPVRRYTTGASEEDLEELTAREQYAEEQIIRHTSGTNIKKQTFIPEQGLPRAGERRISEAMRQVPILSAEEEGLPIAQGARQKYAEYQLTGSLPDEYHIPEEEVFTTTGPTQEDINYAQLKDISEGSFGYGTGSAQSKQQIAAINQSIKEDAGVIRQIKEGQLQEEGYLIPHYDRGDRVTAEDLGIGVQDPRGPRHRFERSMDVLGRLFGAREFILSTATGQRDFGEGRAVELKADEAYATSNRFWGMNLGGRGGAFSEVLRRFLHRRGGLYQEVNDIPNLMPHWMPEEFRYGDPFSQVEGGEHRLPGEAYESMNRLHPDEFGKYGAVDRAAILADIAPWSEEYQLWSRIARSKNLSDREKSKLRRAEDRRKKQSNRYHITEYEFLGSDIERDTAVIDRFVGSGRFKVQGSDEVFRLAGVHPTFDTETEEGQAIVQYLGETMRPGSEITLTAPEHQDTRTATPAVVHADNINVNQQLKELGATPREESSDIQSYLDTGAIGRNIGRAWETLSHANIPIIQNKILNVRSPREHYEDNRVYGKDWQSWQEPISDYVKPSYHTLFARHPAAAVFGGAVFGAISGWILGGSGAKKAMATASAVIAGAGSLYRRGYEEKTGEAWVPARTQEKREIDAYFDALEKVKYKRLYKKYKEKARHEEGDDIAELIAELEEKDEQLKQKEQRAEAYREAIIESGKTGIEKVINREGRVEYQAVQAEEYARQKEQELLAELEAKEVSEALLELGPYGQKAIQYRQEYQSTLAAIDEDSTFQQIFSAIPSEDKEYFQYFSQERDPEAQEEILKLVPENQRRAYQIVWGQTPDEENELEEILEGYHIPDEDWVGWREGVDLEDSKAKLIEMQGLDPKDFGIWRDYTKDEILTPAPVEEPQTFDDRNISAQEVRQQIQSVLESYDINDIEIEVTPREDEKINVNIDVMQDLRNAVYRDIERVMVGG